MKIISNSEYRKLIEDKVKAEEERKEINDKFNELATMYLQLADITNKLQEEIKNPKLLTVFN